MTETTIREKGWVGVKDCPNESFGGLLRDKDENGRIHFTSSLRQRETSFGRLYTSRMSPIFGFRSVTGCVRPHPSRHK